MRKIALLVLLLCFVFAFTACKPLSAQPEIELGNTTGSNESLSNQDATQNPYPSQNIIDKRITVSGNNKIFSNLGVTISFPIDWKFMETKGEDVSTYFLRDSKLGSKCQIVFFVTSSEFLNERTEDEYLEYLSGGEGENIKINSFTKERINGYECTKVVSSYFLEGTEFTRIDYDNVVVGHRLYDFTINYPTSENETFEKVFEAIIDSVELKTTQ